MKKRKAAAASTASSAGSKRKLPKVAEPNVAWHDLPAPVLLQLFQNLHNRKNGIRDVRRAGAVCKTWLSMAEEVLLGDTAASRPKRFAGTSKPVSRPTTSTRATTVVQCCKGDGFEACSRQRPPQVPHPSTIDATCTPPLNPGPQAAAAPAPARAPSNPSSTRAVTTLAASRAPLPRHNPPAGRRYRARHAAAAPSNDHSNSEAAGPLRPTVPSAGAPVAGAGGAGLHRLASASAPESVGRPPSGRAASPSRQLGTIIMGTAGGGMGQTLVSDAGNAGGEEVEGGMAGPAAAAGRGAPQPQAAGGRGLAASGSRSSTLSQQVSGLLGFMWRRWR